MCFPSFPFVTHVLLSPWLTFHLLQVPLAQVGLPKCSPTTWNYRAFKAYTSCPSEIHSAYQNPPPSVGWQDPGVCVYSGRLTSFWSTVYCSSLDSGNYLNNKPTKMNPRPVQRRWLPEETSWENHRTGYKKGAKDKQSFKLASRAAERAHVVSPSSHWHLWLFTPVAVCLAPLAFSDAFKFTGHHLIEAR